MTDRPRRGEIYWVDFDPARGPEPSKVRPALIVQNDIGNRYGATTIVAAITSQAPKKVYPFMVALPPDLLPKPSWVDCAQLRVVTMERLQGRPIGTPPADTLAKVDEALKRSLGLD
jgi:mRNA interferase MazF